MNPAALRSKQKNLRHILDYIVKYDEVSRVALAEAFGLSTATVTNLITELLHQNLVYESRQERVSAGRKTTMLRFNAKLAYIVCISLQAHSDIDITVCDLLGEPVYPRAHYDNIPLMITQERSKAVVLHDIIAAVKAFVDNLPQEISDKLGSIGVCIGGMVNSRGNTDAPSNNWSNLNLTVPLQAALRLPVFMDGVTRVLATYELRYIEPEDKNVIYLNVSTGIGIVNCIDGKLITGRTGIAGEAGHMTINAGGPPCYCGNRGCFESYCGLSYVLLRARELLCEENKDDVFYDLVINKKEPLTAELLFRALRMGSLKVHELLSESAEYLGAGIASLVNIFDPDKIIFFGYEEDPDCFMLENAETEARSRIINRFSRELRIVHARLPSGELHKAVCAFVLAKLLDQMVG